MKQIEVRAALEPHVRERMRALDPTTDLGNGTLLADAVATIVTIDMARRGTKMGKDPAGAVAAVADEQLLGVRQAVLDLMLVTGRSSDRRTLPFGSVLEPGWRSGVAISNKQYVPMRGRPGLHQVPPRTTMERGEGNRRLVDEIAFHMLRLPEMDVARPDANTITVGVDQYAHDVVILPLRCGPGQTYLDDSERVHNPETLLDIEIDLIARSLAGRALDLWEQREDVDREYERVRLTIGDMIEKHRREGLSVRYAGVKTKIAGKGQPWERRETQILIEVLGNDLKPAIWTPFVHRTTLEKVVATQMGVQRRRQRILDESRENGTRGRIDRVTLAAIRAVSPDPAATLRRIATERKLSIPTRLRQKDGNLSLTWRDGQVKSRFLLSDDIVWEHGTLVVKRTTFPQSVIDNLPGRPISALIEHPFLSPDDIVGSARTKSWSDVTWNYFSVKVSTTSFDPETGTTLD